ncbi:MAG: hypothetical protein ABJK11_05615 [Balneola sp.]
MSPEALDAFLAVMSSLKTIALSVANEDEVNFKIKEGSALGVVEAPKSKMALIYKELDNAIKGESDDKIFTSGLRRIQEQFQRDTFDFDFHYYDNLKSEPIALHRRLKNTSRITAKRVKSSYLYKPKILQGYLNQIGGKDPNYHFDYGGGHKITIDCSKEEADSIKNYLYKDINSFVVCKEADKNKMKENYLHKVIIEKEYTGDIKTFIRAYNQENDLVNKLTSIHDFIDESFSKKKKYGFEILSYILKGFNDKNYHLSELKTLLVISKPFINHDKIELARKSLIETYNEKKLKL